MCVVRRPMYKKSRPARGLQNRCIVSDEATSTTFGLEEDDDSDSCTTRKEMNYNKDDLLLVSTGQPGEDFLVVPLKKLWCSPLPRAHSSIVTEQDYDLLLCII